eukprot:Plantae.Rhodophyta-Purpureofilum_apyrenoidigerum.ctg5093.p1 GENE.Plantae.Rhodophyta-Purpureofilum_apyrenoidigerum.ctg5093~~Plantae.Rhodophyta-Purpureofilum_apyrenoidigerum.ctg5093.p1  ORF type:complete len:219 (+),score=50.35 Plantae.Rhodophyta-Purpureofilum_apyrenoidigerum.ctg5093:176-832(+)
MLWRSSSELSDEEESKMAFVTTGFSAATRSKTLRSVENAPKSATMSQRTAPTMGMRARGPAFNPMAASFMPLAAPFLFDMMQPMFTPNKNMYMRFNPRADALEKEKEYVLRFELPGFSKDDVKTEIKGDTLIISGEKHAKEVKEGEQQNPEEKEKQQEEVIRRQTFGWSMHGSFAKSYMVPKDVDRQGISAVMKDGILTVTLLKQAKSEAETTSIPIN